MKSRLNIILLFLFTRYAFCSSPDTSSIASNIVFIEAAGTGVYGSVNYERVFCSKGIYSLSARCGISSYHVNDYTGKLNPDILIPLMVQACVGIDHKIEFGAGQTISSIVRTDADDAEPVRKTNFHTIFSVGYRYQKNTGGIFFRCTYTPMLEFNKRFRHWGGISIGYSF